MARFTSTYKPELALGICERIAEGETLSTICAAPTMPTRQTFNRWVVQYPELKQAFAAARELSAHSLEEEALELGRSMQRRRKPPATEIRAGEAAMNQLRWSASRRNPRVYSERGAVQITVPIQINTSLDMAAGPGVSAEHPNIYQLKALAEVEEPAPDPLAGPLLQPQTARQARRAKMDAARQLHGEVGPKARRAKARAQNPQPPSPASPQDA